MQKEAEHRRGDNFSVLQFRTDCGVCFDELPESDFLFWLQMVFNGGNAMLEKRTVNCLNGLFQKDTSHILGWYRQRVWARVGDPVLKLYSMKNSCEGFTE